MSKVTETMVINIGRRRRRPPPLTASSSSLSSISSTESEASVHHHKKIPKEVQLTTTLPLLVFMDMLAVSLVVPLLFQYYQSAGVSSAGQRELVSSIFSLAQIVGGLVVGAYTDSKWFSRKTVLFFSFGGSALAYALIAYGGSSALIASRVLVGLVKHTMTVSKTMLTQCTSQEMRAQHMGRLSASATAAWVVGPSIGAVLFKQVNHRSPAMVASALFILNMGIAAWLLPDNEKDALLDSKRRCSKDPHRVLIWSTRKPRPRLNSRTCPNVSSFLTCREKKSFNHCNLRSCFSSALLGSLVCASLVVTWVTKATNSNNLSSFFEDLYGLEPHYRGYISSYQQMMGFVIDSFFIRSFLRWIGGERAATCVCAVLLSVVIGLQFFYSTNLAIFLGMVCPVYSLACSIMFTSLQTLITTVCPAEATFSVLATIDVLQSAVSVTVPFYRTILFATLTGNNKTNEAMMGDPDPELWLLTCAFHWLLAGIVLSFFLLSGEKRWSKED